MRVCPLRLSVRLPQAVALLALVAGLPLFLRMPLWCDITLYDIAARNLLQGGAHYRDVFDTNLPGYVWILTAVRWAFGFSSVAVRIVDLAVVAGIVLVIDRVARRGGALPSATQAPVRARGRASRMVRRCYREPGSLAVFQPQFDAGRPGGCM